MWVGRISHKGDDAKKALKIGVDNNDVNFLTYLKRYPVESR